ncbi:MAG: 16S rRNA (cytosine(1402)-N(4))-methyltransferase [Acidimicrobiia bacterium]|nr:16S rRNA (cytosine(1402)-N(4))-methyltransferase [Acidimicrobiia bacterium]
MDPQGSLTVDDVVNGYDEDRLTEVIHRYGDERHARRVARAIVDARPLRSTAELARIVVDAIPAPARRRGGHPATRTFQALRIEVNDELRILPGALDRALEALAPAGRCAVLAYHSGEDRIVKDRFEHAVTGGCTCPPRLPCACGARPTARWVRKRSRRAGASEVEANPAAASARLRAVERLDDPATTSPETEARRRAPAARASRRPPESAAPAPAEHPRSRPRHLRVVRPDERPRRRRGVTVAIVGSGGHGVSRPLRARSVFHTLLVQSQSQLDRLDEQVGAETARTEDLRNEITGSRVARAHPRLGRPGRIDRARARGPDRAAIGSRDAPGSADARRRRSHAWRRRGAERTWRRDRTCPAPPRERHRPRRRAARGLATAGRAGRGGPRRPQAGSARRGASGGPPSGPFRGRAGVPRRRLVAAAVVLGFLFVALGARLVELQTVSPDRYVALAQSQTVRTQILSADRGAIYDRNGEELAVSVPAQTIYADPKFVEDAPAAARALAPVLDLDETELVARLTASSRFEYLGRQVSDEVARAVEELAIPASTSSRSRNGSRRPATSPGRSVGQTDIDNKGLGGLELQYDDVLTGEPGRLTLEQDPAGRTIPVGQHELVPAREGDDLVLTIDRALQYEAERQLLRQVGELGAKGGTVVISDPRTGEILAMVNVDRDPATDEPRLSANNMALTTVYEPGSIMKAVTWSQGFEQGVVDTDVCVNAPDSLTIADKTFTEYEPHGSACWMPERAIASSSNTAAINVARAVGRESLHGAFRDFGLGERTGLGLPERAVRCGAPGGRVVGDVPRLDVDRPGHLGHADADAARLQHPCERRAPRAAEAGTIHAGSRRYTPPHSGHRESPGGVRGDGRDDDRHAARRGRRRHRPIRRRRRLRRLRQDRHRAQALRRRLSGTGRASPLHGQLRGLPPVRRSAALDGRRPRRSVGRRLHGWGHLRAGLRGPRRLRRPALRVPAAEEEPMSPANASWRHRPGRP